MPEWGFFQHILVKAASCQSLYSSVTTRTKLTDVLDPMKTPAPRNLAMKSLHLSAKQLLV
jgi:hypothetical protein